MAPFPAQSHRSDPGPGPRYRLRRKLSAIVASVAAVVLESSCAGGGSALISRTSPLMGTTVTISVVTGDRARGERAVQKGFAEVARLEQILSSYRADSDLSRLNRQAGAGPVRVSPDLLELTEVAKLLASRTRGAFNPLMGPVIKLWGIPENPRLPSNNELAALRPLTDLARLSTRSESLEMSLALPGMALGLGGIGKGFAADRVVALLEGASLRGGLVAVGGDTRVFGRRPDGQLWRIAIPDPRPGQPPLSVIELGSGAVSTSGTYERFFEVDGIRYHHIFDPRTLMPVMGLTSVTILARDGTHADALATAVLVMGDEDGMTFVEGTPDVETLMVDVQGQIAVSSGWPHLSPQ